MVMKARGAQMTNDAIERAIKRGIGDNDGEVYEAITYEGYAPGGVALLIEVLTDNRNRTGAEVRNVFSKLGGSMAEPGAVAWQFDRRGVVLVSGDAAEDDVMLVALEAGADDVTDEGGTWRVLCEPSDVYEVKAALEAANLEVQSAESTMISSTTIEVSDPSEAKKVLRIMDALEDNDDVQDVYANFDIPEATMSEVLSEI
jgi:YebC/PmpR family DNA-binding regulatory protein